MELVDFSPARANPDRRASVVPLGHGSGAGHVYAVHMEPGGEIAPHPADFGQLYLVVAGGGWVSGVDGVRLPVATGAGAFIPRGEVHAKGSASGMTAIMVQLTELHAATPA
jgi:quercetin dioxygenase-like cupin family protein